MDRPIITSRQNPLVKYFCGLAEKNIRSKEGLFRFDGIKLLREALHSDVEIRYVVYREPIAEGVNTLVKQALDGGKISSENVIAVSAEVFDKISEEKSPEGVITVVRMMERVHIRGSATEMAELIEGGERILIAESLRDPANLGTIMRSAYALGIDRLVLTDDCAEIYSPKTIRAAMGAAFRMSTLTVKGDSLTAFIGALRASGRRVYATALYEDSLTLGEIELSARDCFVIGNEGHGLSKRAVEACDASVIIPMREDAESLNAAAAAAICIWETVRARP